ncbi:MAG: hypothetical protein HY961_06445 [Ignavibacteriae bacterium]|nr:hypothetical protein [Ignavibacteriota bacterium]
MSESVKETLQRWPGVSQFVFVPQTEEQYARLVALLDELIDEVGEDERHPLASLMDVIGVLIEKYEDDHIPKLN